MTVAQPRRRRPTQPDRLTIGAVIAALREDFPDVSVSKLRFLEAAGLVHPARTASGYRVYARSDVERIRYVLTAQRERFWPLRVIREALDAMDRGLTVPVAGADERPAVPPEVSDPLIPSALELAAPRLLRLTAEELRSTSGLSREMFGALQEYGVLPLGATDFTEDHLAIARAAGALAAYGVEARHLRSFRTAADREIGLAQQVRAPAKATPGRGAMDDPTAEVLRHCIALHVALVRSGLSG